MNTPTNAHASKQRPRGLDPKLLPMVKLLARLLVDEHDAGKGSASALASAPKTGQTPNA